MKFLLLWISVLFFACSDVGSKVSIENVGSKSVGENMLLVHGNGARTVLGVNRFDVNANERPAMPVEFTYDFYIGKSEVTCGEFNSLMKSLTLDCDKDRPVVNVTYFDAILFANARSKSEGYDTVYTYTAAEYDDDGHCVNLEFLNFLNNVDGFRLPTEAEWVLVASKHWDPSAGWHESNSDGEPHDVCTARESSKDNDVCDMEGNVSEWVNDWLGRYVDSTVTDYMGAPDGGSVGERVIKGGSFRNSLDAITLSNRSDVYTVTSSTMAEYVGFRLAYGKIGNPTWISPNGMANTSRISVMTSADVLRAKAGTIQSKIVFRNDVSGNLAYLDFSDGLGSVVEIKDTIDAYHPEISPDGKKVAFSTKYEGISGKSELYVRDLMPSGSNLVKLNVESAAIPRWNVLPNGDTVIVYVDDAGNNKDESNFKKSSTWQVKFSNGKFGTPEKLFDGAFHGGVSQDRRLAVTGARLLRAKVADSAQTLSDASKNEVWYNSEQACNVSLNRDESKRTLFLDFSGKTGTEFAADKYGVHEMLLIADSVGHLIQTVPAPKGYSFDHSEWAVEYSSVPQNFVVAALTNVNGVHEKIVLVNIEDSSIIDIASGEELWHPNIWIRPQLENGDVDSVGVYYKYASSNIQTASTVELGMKLKAFWSMHNDVEFVALGSSMVLNAVIDDSIKTYKSLNMGVTLTDIHMFKHLLFNYVFPYAKNLKAVMVELSPGFLFRYEEEHFGVVFSYSPGLRYDAHFLNEKTVETVAENSQKIDYPTDRFIQEYIEGSFVLPSSSWGDSYVAVDLDRLTLDFPSLKMSLQKIRDIKNYADSIGVKFFMTITPRNPAYRKTDSFGVFGPSRNNAHAIIDSVRNMGIMIFDENKDGLHDYSKKEAYNNTHVSFLGAAKYSVRLDSVLKTLK